MIVDIQHREVVRSIRTSSILGRGGRRSREIRNLRILGEACTGEK